MVGPQISKLLLLSNRERSDFHEDSTSNKFLVPTNGAYIKTSTCIFVRWCQNVQVFSGVSLFIEWRAYLKHRMRYMVFKNIKENNGCRYNERPV